MCKPKFKFNLGDIVALDPTGKMNADLGKVTGRIEYIDGSVGYCVSAACFRNDSIIRHVVAEYEIRLDVEPG